MPEKDYLRAFPYDPETGVLSATPAAISSLRAPDGMPGAALSLSADDRSNGILWAQVPKFDAQWDMAPGSLIAFDALSLKVLWRDDDDVAFSKFTPVTIAGGKVFRPTFGNELIVYGLGGSNAQPCYSIAELYSIYGRAHGMLGASVGPKTTLPDGVGNFQAYVGRTPSQSVIADGAGVSGGLQPRLRA